MLSLTFLLLALPSVALADDFLPTAEYHRQPGDPEWLAQVVQFHGHLGPAVVAGARMGMIGLRAVEAKGYFDVKMTCEGPFAKPPQSCFLDGIQVATGATMGKRTLDWVQGDGILLRVENTRTGKVAVVCPTPALMDLLGSFRSKPLAETRRGSGQQDHQELEATARKIAGMPEKDIASVTTHAAALRVPEHIERGMMMDPVQQKERLRRAWPERDRFTPRR